MSNLLEETRKVLRVNNKAEKEVRWIGSANGAFVASWEEFVHIANVDYNNGYGGQEVVSDLVVVGDSWWLERHEYDGSEWWEFKSLPTRKDKAQQPRKVVYGLWATMAEAHREED